jgi:TolB-like protein/Tfp pilus assembly protein PilF
MSFITELKRRNVFRVCIAYVIGAWVIAQVADLVLDNIEAPDWVMQAIMLVLAIGLPLALILAWAFELTPEGIKREADVDRTESTTHVTGRKFDFAIIGLLAVALIFVVVDNYVLEAEPEQAVIAAEQIPAAEPIEREKSIAVLPFVNMSSDPEQEYFSDGISEEILNELAQLPGLRVASRTSAFTFKGENRNMGEIAAILKVNHVLEGSVRKSGNRVRIAAQLIDASNEKHLWSEVYDRELTNIFAIQSEIARAVAQEIKIELSPEKEAVLTSTRTVDPEAHEAYLRGQYEAAKFTADSYTRAIEHFQNAMSADPEYAPAYAGLANSYFMLGQPLAAMRHRDAMPKAKKAALKALELDPSLPAAYSALASVAWIYDWDWKTADQMFRRAIELSPNSADAYSDYGIYLSAMGRHAEAIAQGQRAAVLDPLDLSGRAVRAEYYIFARDYDRAIEELQGLIEIEPTFARAYSIFGWIYNVSGRFEEAIEASRKEGKFTDEEAASLQAAFSDHGRNGYWRWHRERYETERSKGHPVNLIELAWVYAQLGNADAAFALLDEAFEMRNGDLTFLKVDSYWDPIRGDPRFDELLRRMNFPDS